MLSSWPAPPRKSVEGSVDAVAPKSLAVGVLGLVLLCEVALSIVLKRIFSAALGYHFAFLAVSLALFGIGAGGAVVALRPSSGRPRLFGRLAVVSGVASVAAAIAVIHAMEGHACPLQFDRRGLLSWGCSMPSRRSLSAHRHHRGRPLPTRGAVCAGIWRTCSGRTRRLVVRCCCCRSERLAPGSRSASSSPRGVVFATRPPGPKGRSLLAKRRAAAVAAACSPQLGAISRREARERLTVKQLRT